MNKNARCTECYGEEVVYWGHLWWNLPMNEEIRGYARSYISSPKLHWPDLQSALKAWGNGVDDRSSPY